MCLILFISGYLELINIAVYRPVAKQWFCKQRPLQVNARNMNTTIEERGYETWPWH
jgi:hypothetical protein